MNSEIHICMSEALQRYFQVDTHINIECILLLILLLHIQHWQYHKFKLLHLYEILTCIRIGVYKYPTM